MVVMVVMAGLCSVCASMVLQYVLVVEFQQLVEKMELFLDSHQSTVLKLSIQLPVRTSLEVDCQTVKIWSSKEG